MFRTTRPAVAPGVVILTTAVALALTGCTPDTEASPLPTATGSGSPTATSTPAPTSSKSPEPTSPADAATETAEQVVRDYYAMLDASLQTPDTFNPDDFKQVASTTALSDALLNLDYTLRNGQHQIGSTTITSVTPTSVNLSPSDGVPVIEFRVCWDVSDLNVVDAEGKSVVPADRAPLGVERVGVANYDSPDGPWTVDFTEWKQGEPC